MLLFLCFTSAQTRPVSCSLAVGGSDLVSKLCPRSRSWTGLDRLPLKLKPYWTNMVWVGERFCIMAMVDLRIFLTSDEQSHRPSLYPGEDVLWLPVAAPAQEPARKRKGWEE